jgi:hypothetical protein
VDGEFKSVINTSSIGKAVGQHVDWLTGTLLALTMCEHLVALF